MQPYKIGDKLKCLNVTMSRHYIERNWAVCAGLNVGNVYTVEKDSIDGNWVYIEDTPYALSTEHFELIKQEYKIMKVTTEVTQEYVNQLVQAILNVIEPDVLSDTAWEEYCEADEARTIAHIKYREALLVCNKLKKGDRK